jgi:hypothetical protein
MSSRDEVMYRVCARTMPHHPRNLRGGNRWPAATNRHFVRQSVGSLDVLYCEGLVCVFDIPRFARLAAVRLPRLSRRGVLESISPESSRALMAVRQRASYEKRAAELAVDYIADWTKPNRNSMATWPETTSSSIWGCDCDHR